MPYRFVGCRSRNVLPIIYLAGMATLTAFVGHEGAADTANQHAHRADNKQPSASLLLAFPKKKHTANDKGAITNQT